jgi:hypothetical protein
MNYMIKTKGKNPNIWPGSHEIKSVWLSYIWWKQQLKEDINIDVAKYNLTLSSFHIKRDRYMNGDWSNSCDGDMGMDLICGLCPLGWGLFVFSLLWGHGNRCLLFYKHLSDWSQSHILMSIAHSECIERAVCWDPQQCYCYTSGPFFGARPVVDLV